MIDGINQLVSLYKNQDEFVKAFLEITLFITPEIVRLRNQEMIELYKTGGKFPIRYSPSHHEALGIKNKAEAIALTRDNEARLPAYPSFNIKIDNDGNHENRRSIKKYLGQTISTGKNSTVKNYIISHVWGLASHPLFFSSLWNIVLIPAHLNYLMDKDPESHPVVKIVKESIRCKCASIYNVYDQLAPKIPEIEEFRRLFLIDIDKSQENELTRSISFLTREGIELQREEIYVSEDEQALLENLLGKMGKKFFIDYYEAYANGEDLMNVIPIGMYTYSSVQTRISTMKRIFRENLNLKALIYILSKDKSKLDNESIELAKELIELG
jgi:hypothetical protein